jgi:pimeloyl-ACP methyl ester carboxylesterase
MQVQGKNWQVDAQCELWAWEDLVGADAAVSLPMRLIRAVVTFFDLFVSGTIFRYFRANLRYAMFALFPPLQIALFAAGSWIVARLVTSWLDLSGKVEIASAAVIALILFIMLLQWPGRRWRVQQALDDWILARDYVLGRRAGLDARLDEFVDGLLARAAQPGIDEIIIVGHSLGAIFALDIVARALARDPQFARKSASVCVLTVGATIPKCTLHPAARPLREKIARVVNEPSVFWAEYQARDDAISFYKFDPVALQKIDDDQLAGKPIIRRVHIHDMLQPATFAKHNWRFLRLHYQFVMANDRPAAYDYFMMMCGPVRFAQWTVAPRGILDFVSPDGAARAPVAAAEPAL